jgi:hypothetical protein
MCKLFAVFVLSDRVTIIGGVLQEYGVRLDGLTGIVTSSRHDAPPGTIAVYVYWNESPYRERVEELPKWVNVPPEFLCATEESSTPPTPTKRAETKPARGGLRLVD